MNNKQLTRAPRRLIWLAGKQAWGLDTAKSLIKNSSLDASAVYWHCPKNPALNLLGQDKHLVIINAYEGLNPNDVGRLSGTIQAGGALIIISPKPSLWPAFADPQSAKLCPYPLKYRQIKGRYLNRWVRLLGWFNGVELIRPNDHQTIAPICVSPLPCDLGRAYTPDQQTAIQAIIKTSQAQGQQLAIITADRGRGKSSALGLAAAQIMLNTESSQIIVTSSGFNQARTVFKHAQAALTEIRFDLNHKTIIHQNSTLSYRAIDVLLSDLNPCDLLIVDEAASIGVAQLEQLLAHYPKIVFATTEHGYEGCGRGFALKFRQLLQAQKCALQTLTLQGAIRWSDHDPLELWINQLLLLTPQKMPDRALSEIEFESLAFTSVSQTNLSQNETLLREVFTLLVDAHYQTRPVDLRHLLDAPNIQLWLARQDDQLLGLVWLMQEGRLDNAMAQNIVQGNRRPQGHLAPQILAAHLGLAQAASQFCTRIQRIVVLPQLQSKGLGTWMLKQLESQLANDVDYIATSFGAEANLLKFWQQAGFTTVRFSDQANAASGLRSALSLKPLSRKGEQLLVEAQAFFEAQFIAQLSSRLSKLAPALVETLCTNFSSDIVLSATELKTACLFAHHKRPYESSLVALKQLAILSLSPKAGTACLSKIQRHLLILKTLQNRSWSSCALSLGLSGRKECIEQLRHGTKKLLVKLA